MKFCMTGWCGHSYYLLEGLKKLPDFELAGAASGMEGDDGSAIAERLQKNGVAFSGKFYSDYLEMLDAVHPDAVSVDGPFHLHGAMCLEAVRRGIHVFCEKPVALELAELAEIEKAAADSKCLITSMMGLRYEPAFYTARQLVQNGAVGRIKLIHAQKSYRFGKRPEFYKKRSLYGGTIPWVGSHAIDWILWFTGSHVESVTAFHDIRDNHGYESLEIAGSALFRMQNGAIATMNIDFLRPEAAPSHGDDRIRIAGTAGILEVRHGMIHLTDNAGERSVEAQSPPQSFFEDFIGSIRGANPPPMTTAETMELTKMCLLTRKSADLHTTEYVS